jgi:hypothetical protein
MSNNPAKPTIAPMDIPADGMDTPFGYLYRPLSGGRQALVLIAAFAGCLASGWIIGEVPGDLSESARTALVVPMFLIFFMGYGLWITRLNAIAFRNIGWGLLKSLVKLIVLRRKPESVTDLLPDRDTLIEMAVRAQQAGASFAPIGWLVGLVCGLFAMLIESETKPIGLFLLVAGACVIQGHALAWLGRRAWLPFMESE